MIDMRYKPRHLPQISAPFDMVIKKLNEEGIKNEIVEVDPNDLKPMQGIVFSDEVGTFNPNEMNPIWISNDNEIIDGHHRFLAALMAKKPITCIKLELNGKDGARELNKIQDIYDYEQQQQMEEVVNQDVINTFNSIDDGESTNEFLSSLKETEIPEGNACTIIAYRKKPIMENSVIGNFFILKPIDGYDKYEIEFENLLDTDDMGIQFGDQHPIDVLAKMWFPNVDFKKMSAPFTHSPIEFKNKAIAERAAKMGYDGIKYGDLILQGLK